MVKKYQILIQNIQLTLIQIIIVNEGPSAHNLYALSWEDSNRISNNKIFGIGGQYNHNYPGVQLLEYDIIQKKWKIIKLLFDGNISGCIEKRSGFNNICEFDGQTTMIFFMGEWFIYCRANISPEGGYRAVQVTRSKDLEHFEPFKLVNFKNHDDVNDIYYVHPYLTPHKDKIMVIAPIAYKDVGNIAISFSSNGINFEPFLNMMTMKAYQGRTADLPCNGIDWISDHKFRILIHKNVKHRVSNSEPEKLEWYEWTIPESNLNI